MSDETTPEPYADLGATTREAMDIAETSMQRVRTLVPDDTLGDRLRQKAVHATGDPEFQYLVRLTNDPARAGGSAVLADRPIVTDVSMVEAGITSRGHSCPVRSAIGAGTALAEQTGMTRTAASVLTLDRSGAYDEAIAVVGNAPTGALALADCIEAGTRPAVVVATPVGFVKAHTAKERLRSVGAATGVPVVSSLGRRGGSGLAAGLTNELIHIGTDARDGTISLQTDD